MFQKIRIQLVAVNALVILVMLVAGGFALYTYMHNRLTVQIDESMQETSRDFQLKVNPLGQPVAVRLGRPADEPLAALIRDGAGNVIGQFPEDAVPEAELEVLDRLADRMEQGETIELADNLYRVMTVPLMRPRDALPFQPFVPRDPASVTVQLIRNIDSEQAILDRLLMVIVVGILAGSLVTVLAGFFLAGRALVPIRQAWEKQQQFVADASHELRTPLAVIRSHSELMLRHPHHTILDESQHVSVVLRESQRMSKLVSDLLTLARSDSNQMELRHEPLRLDRTLGEVAEQFRQLAEMEEKVLETQLEEPVEWMGDDARLRQLFVILLDNALKYTPEGGSVTVTLRTTFQGAEIAVADTGVGMSAEELPLIFDRFYRGDKVRGRSEGGTGLGLSIAKWIVEAHHGRIHAESQLGAGTKMIVTLPRTHGRKKHQGS